MGCGGGGGGSHGDNFVVGDQEGAAAAVCQRPDERIKGRSERAEMVATSENTGGHAAQEVPAGCDISFVVLCSF